MSAAITLFAVLLSLGRSADAAVNESRAVIPAKLSNGPTLQEDLPWGDWRLPAEGLTAEEQAMYLSASKVGWQRTWRSVGREVRVSSLVVPSSFDYPFVPPTTVPGTTPDGLVELDRTRQVLSADCTASSSQKTSSASSGSVKKSSAKSRTSTTKKGAKTKAAQSVSQRASNSTASSSDEVTTRDTASCVLDETVYGRATPGPTIKRNDDGLRFADTMFHAQVRGFQKHLVPAGFVGGDVNLPTFAPANPGSKHQLRLVVLRRGRALVTVSVEGPDAESTIDGIVGEVLHAVDAAGLVLG